MIDGTKRPSQECPCCPCGSERESWDKGRPPQVRGRLGRGATAWPRIGASAAHSTTTPEKTRCDALPRRRSSREECDGCRSTATPSTRSVDAALSRHDRISRITVPSRTPAFNSLWIYRDASFYVHAPALGKYHGWPTSSAKQGVMSAVRADELLPPIVPVETIKQISAAVESLDRDQLIWASGYLAGLAAGRAAHRAAAAAAVPAERAEPAAPWSIFYAT